MAEATAPSTAAGGGGCDVCGAAVAAGKLQKCGQCGWRCYCGAECQRKDWKQMQHKRVCKAIVGVRQGKVHLQKLIRDNLVEEVQGLVLSGTVGVNTMLKPGPWGPLQYACFGGLLEMATMLVEVGADVELRTADEFGFTALIAAAQEGHNQIVRMLLERGGADPNVGTADQDTTPLFMATQDGHLDAVKVLVEVGRADVDLARTSDGFTPLKIAAQIGHFEIVRYLVQTGGADANKVDHEGCTLLFVAALQGHLDVVMLLVQTGGADANKPNHEGLTPLYAAAQQGHLETVSYLVQTGGADANKPDNNGYTPLHAAARHGHLDVVKLLVRDGKADVNCNSNKGATPLHIAIAYEHTFIVKFLVRNGAQDTSLTFPDTGESMDVDDLANRVGDQTLTDYVASKRCSVCNELCKPKLCKGCMKVGYCSSACQKRDWSEHKQVCKKC